MKLLDNWFDPQIHGSVSIFTEDEDDTTLLYQMLGPLCFYVVLTCKWYNHLEIIES